MSAAGPALFGFRVSMSDAGESYVIGAPARGTEAMLDQRRHDLAVLVACATVLGALAALWLSQVASRSLAEPIGALRVAALAIARGEREPPLAARAPDEFQPVFSAFRRMAADLGESRVGARVGAAAHRRDSAQRRQRRRRARRERRDHARESARGDDARTLAAAGARRGWAGRRDGAATARRSRTARWRRWSSSSPCTGASCRRG